MTTKFHKTFGQVEVLNQDLNTTTILVLKTNEVKKLINQFANLSDSPFVELKVKKVSQAKIKLTKEEEERVAISVNNTVRKAIEDGKLRKNNLEQWIENAKYRQAGSNLR
jgi:DTW domain-containing protein YfiP